MPRITFIDLEVQPNGTVADFGAIDNDEKQLHGGSVSRFTEFIRGSDFLAGHNILRHDLTYVRGAVRDAGLDEAKIIDTLHLSPLLFPTNPYHRLVKDEKLQTDELNNPLNDAIKARDLFNDEVAKFYQLPDDLRKIYTGLLAEQAEFAAFFRLLSMPGGVLPPEKLIRSRFRETICERAALDRFIEEHPVALAYCLALITSDDRHSVTPPWVVRNYPATDRIMLQLRNRPCLEGCTWCNRALDVHTGLLDYFGYPAFRSYAGEPLQEEAAKAAVQGRSLLAVFPTGGGKSVTFQLPALMAGRNSRGLTVVISPLQSLMKDQVDGLEKKHAITEAVTINGLLDPIERAKSIGRVYDGSASILYISPESLRSKTIENLLLGRKIERFVIDEAHCFSAWGQDFRVDYLYIGDFIKSLQEQKNLDDPIPVSCFTATAKRKVIEDIRTYFQEKLSLNLAVFQSSASRTNLTYQVFEKGADEEKYTTVRDLVEAKNCPTIVYVARTKRADELAARLAKDGFNARAFHGKMKVNDKIANQDAFISGSVQVMVATSAFGMGVDKKDVGLVIHYDISDSLENYMQEAGRAGRDEETEAECYVLFNEDDLGKHFVLLNQTRLSVKEIKQIWKAVKELTKFRSKASNSVLEIARKAGWDESIREIDTRVTTAIAALEEAGYLKRGQNSPRVFATSILVKTAQEAIDKINASTAFTETEKVHAERIIKKLISSRSRKSMSSDDAESRVDHISDQLGIPKDEVIRVVTLLKQERILADTKDLSAYIRTSESRNRSLAVTETFNGIEQFLLGKLTEVKQAFHLKDLNEAAEREGYADVTVEKLQTVLTYWSIRKWIKRTRPEHSVYYQRIRLTLPKHELEEKHQKRRELARFITDFLFARSQEVGEKEGGDATEILVEFSVGELKTAFEQRNELFRTETSIDEVEDALFYLSKIGAIKIEDGFLVTYNRLTLDRLEKDTRKQYKQDDYQKLGQFYENKIQQIHIVGEFARKMITDIEEALRFVDDYFKLNSSVFLDRYFPGSKQHEIKRSITPKLYRKLYDSLSQAQQAIVRSEANYIVVKAGPGSGKTKVLVHKMASLLMLEEVKHEQLLMLTFSRAAATEFKKRLIDLVQGAAQFVEIRTFHSYCFDLLGRVGSLDKADEDLIPRTIKKIEDGEVEASRITKTVLVIDEAQDMTADEYRLVELLIARNEDLRVIAVGDDDQNIYQFRGSDSAHFAKLMELPGAESHELVDNYRSKDNLVEFANGFANRIHQRMKSQPIRAFDRAPGTLQITQYVSRNLIDALINDVLATGLAGTTGALTATNDEALLVTSLLRHHNRPARLIQENDGFNPYNLVELRYFMQQFDSDSSKITISEEAWENAKRAFKQQFWQSDLFEFCQELIRDFETLSPKVKYRSDLELFIRESSLDDFYRASGETILVSTIHKAKGREFDNVFLLLDRFDASTDEKKRVLYVGLTRAKGLLSIHTNGDHFNGISVGNLDRREDQATYHQPGLLTRQFTLKDIWLDDSKNYQREINGLMSGDPLFYRDGRCFTGNEKPVTSLSTACRANVEGYLAKGYQIREMKVNFVVYWWSEQRGEEVKVVLPEVRMEVKEIKADRKGGGD